MPGGGAVASSRRKHEESGSDGGGAHAGAHGLEDLSLDRLEFVAVLKRRLQRARRFRTLPLALALLCLYMAAMMSRSGLIQDAHDFDRACVSEGAPCASLMGFPPHAQRPRFTHPPPFLPPLAPPFPCSLLLNVWGTDPNLGYAQPTTVQGWLTYVGALDASAAGDTLARRLFLSGDVLGNAAATYAAQGVLPGAGLVIGGAVLSQTRYAPAPCPWGVNITALWPGQFSGCRRGGELGGGPYFPGGSAAAPNASLVPPFEPLPGSIPPAFAAYLSAYDDLDLTTLPYLQQLLAYGWVDDATASLTFSAAFVNPEVARVAHARHSITSTRGGLTAVASRVQSVLLDPYGIGAEGGGGGGGRPPPAPGLSYGLDAVALFYLLYIWAGTLKRTLRACCAAGDASECCPAACSGRARRGGERRRPQQQLPWFWSALCARMPLESAAVDWFACCALLAAVCLWSAHVGELEGVRAALAALPPLAPDESGPLPVPGPGSAAGVPGGPPPWAAVEQRIGAAVDSYVRYQTGAILALIALTAQVVKYASFQAHFGVLGATLLRSARDMYHFAVLLILFLVAFGVWAQFSYGHHMSLWSGEAGGALGAAVGIVRFMMYDYDIAAMAYADGTGLAGLYYILFMMGITNIMLWLVRCTCCALAFLTAAWLRHLLTALALHPRTRNAPHFISTRSSLPCSLTRTLLSAQRRGSGPQPWQSCAPLLPPCPTCCQRRCLCCAPAAGGGAGAAPLPLFWAWAGACTCPGAPSLPPARARAPWRTRAALRPSCSLPRMA